MQGISLKDFPGIAFGDVRREERFIKILENLTSQPGASIPQQNEDWYATKATYNFFRNEDVSIEILQGIIKSYGVAQIKSAAPLLLIHDISNISYNDLQAEGLGYLDNKEGRGILCYSTIAASTEGLPLALMYQHTWVRPIEHLGKSKNRKRLDFEEKETYKWYQGMTAVNESIGEGTQKIHIADREGDVYDLFFHAYEKNTDLLIRARHNRRRSDGCHLWDEIAKLPMQEKIKLQVPDVNGKHRIEIEASLKYQEVEILRPTTSKNKYESVKLTAIEITQLGEVENEEDRIHWKLLTTLQINTVQEALQCVRWYTYRWLIERFHYVLKSGTRIEQLQFKKAIALQKAISVYSIAAFKIMQMVYQSRHTPDASCEVVLPKNQWKVLYMLINKNKALPKQIPTLLQAMTWIGKLGGHLGRKSDGPPGLKTVWQGYQKLCNATNIYEILK
jgi:Transposase DNA-binding/Transposase Tn5 dimerisation domain